MLFTHSARRRSRSCVESLERRTLLAAAAPGQPDPTFSGDGIVTIDIPGFTPDVVSDIALDAPRNRIIVAGDVRDGVSARIALAALDLNGNLIPSFSGDGIETELFGLTTPGREVLVQPDGKILVLIERAAGSTVVRFTVGGARDTSFAGGGEAPAGFATDMALMPDGRIVLGGTNAEENIAAYRLMPSGSPDSSFGGGDGIADTNFTTVSGDVAFRDVSIGLAPSGKIILSGSAPGERDQDPRDTADAAVIRLNPDGTPDASFGGDGLVEIDNDTPNHGRAVTFDRQGRLLVGMFDHGGAMTVQLFTTDDGERVEFGAVDARLVPGLVPFSVDSLEVGSDGKVIMSGLGGTTSGGLLITARFNPDGGLDTDFGNGGVVVREDKGSTARLGFFAALQSDAKVLTAETSDGKWLIRRLRASGPDDVLNGSIELGADRVLRLLGTSAGERVQVTADETVITATVGEFEETFLLSKVSRIELHGLGGNDFLRVFHPINKPSLLNGGSGNDEMFGGAGNDTLLGLDGNDQLFGQSGDDLLDGGTGTDVQFGGSGADTIDYHFRNSAVTVDLDGLADDGPAGENDTVGADVEHILGGNGADTLIGNGNPNFIRGNGGNDTIRGGGGNDTLVGDAGQDRLFGDAGDDFLDAKDGITDLVLDGGSGFDKARKDNSDPRTSIEQLVA